MRVYYVGAFGSASESDAYNAFNTKIIIQCLVCAFSLIMSKVVIGSALGR